MYFTMAEKCLFGFLILFIIFSIIFVSMSIYKDSKKRDYFASKCEIPFYFVNAEHAADGLTRVNCLSEQGEKKEILIKEK